MKDIVIFGDSYAEYDPEVTNEKISWVHNLHKKYNVKNYAAGSTGPEHATSLFNKLIEENKDLSNTVCLFFLSEQWRPYFSFWENKEDQNLFRIILFDDNFDHLSTKQKKRIKFYKTHYGKFCKDYFKYKYYPSYERDAMLGHIGTLLMFSSLFEKMLIWPTFHNAAFDNVEKLRISQNYKNVTIFSKSLFDLIGVSGGDFIRNDPRINHMNDFNNQIMFEELDKWLTSSYSVDISRFKHEG